MIPDVFSSNDNRANAIPKFDCYSETAIRTEVDKMADIVSAVRRWQRLDN